MWKCIPDRIKIWRECTTLLSLDWGKFLFEVFIFLSSTLFSGPVRCDGCGTFLFSKDCVELCEGKKIYFFRRLVLSLRQSCRGGSWQYWECEHDIPNFIQSTVWSGESSAELEKLGESGENLDYQVINQNFLSLIIRGTPHETRESISCVTGG